MAHILSHVILSTMSSNIKVSILIPIYNVEKYLRECLESVVNQTLRDIEIICLNDGSTDSSLKIIEEFAKDDERIVIVNKKNSGYGDSMNIGLEKAKGEYIGIVESDDYIELNAFERLYSLASLYGADVVRSNYYHLKGGKNKKYSYIEAKNVNRIIDPARNIWIFYQAPAIWSAIYKKEFLVKNKIKFLPTPGASYQDTGFNFKVWASTKKAVFTDEAFLHYRLDNDSSSVNNPGKVFNVCKEYEEIEKYLRSRGLYETFGEVMQMAKFGAYYWNIYRLSPNLRKDFLEKAKEEFLIAENEHTLNESLFLDKEQWHLLNRILNDNVEKTLRYIRVSDSRIKVKKILRMAAKRCLYFIRPSYKKQKEISKLIDELSAENVALRQKIRSLERRIEDGKNEKAKN